MHVTVQDSGWSRQRAVPPHESSEENRDQSGLFYTITPLASTLLILLSIIIIILIFDALLLNQK